jgi:hypothetical protein
MRRTSSNSSDIFKAAHKLDKYLMKGETRKQQPKKAAPILAPSEDIEEEDPLSMPRVGEGSTVDCDVIITNAIRKPSSDPISKYNLKRKLPPSTQSTKKSKTEQTEHKEDIDEPDVKVKPNNTGAKKEPKTISAKALLDDDDDDDVLNFTMLEGVS